LAIIWCGKVRNSTKPILGCLITYEGDKLIACTKNDIIFTLKNLNNDYNEFHLTLIGVRADAPYGNVIKI
jgi:hypothetical protein